ncbi:YfbU family protein [Liquorilactobacillus nagelii]|uniref:YfbU family protein n=1 Tax=Liquorilactobacillus nagelii TaxID=82688 RepID=UPI0006F0755E|nr:YfbU family protein [Liquorilactobacillus nagelii]KRL40744.1 hypothetical protein FD45_GL001389 [Liquorilactobacillus nagelii DSM 13675]QYH53708.1 hypothetical protein G6O73_02930 [Liquorilactobacillus nagelii DSM 13675]
MKLTAYQRLNLINQFIILKRLDKVSPSRGVTYYDETQFDNYIEILQMGYEGLYDEIFNYLDKSVVDEKVSEFVNQVLYMYDRGYLSYQKLPKEDKELFDSSNLKFPGFDGNDEINYYGYCNFFINEMGRYQYVLYKNSGKTKDVNSHSNTLSRYSKMTLKFKQYEDENKNGGILNLNQLKDVFELSY